MNKHDVKIIESDIHVKKNYKKRYQLKFVIKHTYMYTIGDRQTDSLNNYNLALSH